MTTGGGVRRPPGVGKGGGVKAIGGGVSSPTDMMGTAPDADADTRTDDDTNIPGGVGKPAGRAAMGSGSGVAGPGNDHPGRGRAGTAGFFSMYAEYASDSTGRRTVNVAPMAA